MGVYLTSEEVEALFDCSEKRLKNRDRAAFLYLRERMDSATLLACVGWKALAVALEELPVQGSTEKPFRPTREAIRWILRRLEDKNLIKQIHSQKMAESVFGFPLYGRVVASEKRGTIEEPWSNTQMNTHDDNNDINTLHDKKRDKKTQAENEKRPHYPIHPIKDKEEDTPLPTLPIPDAGTPKKRSRPEYPPEFLQAVAAYPARQIPIDKAAAFKAWNARRKEGHAVETIQDGIERYKRCVIAEGNLGTQFVKMMATFLGPADPPFFTLPWKISGQPGITRGTDGHYDTADYRSGATDQVDWMQEGEA